MRVHELRDFLRRNGVSVILNKRDGSTGRLLKPEIKEAMHGFRGWTRYRLRNSLPRLDIQLRSEKRITYPRSNYWKGRFNCKFWVQGANQLLFFTRKRKSMTKSTLVGYINNLLTQRTVQKRSPKKMRPLCLRCRLHTTSLLPSYVPGLPMSFFMLERANCVRTMPRRS